MLTYFVLKVFTVLLLILQPKQVKVALCAIKKLKALALIGYLFF